MKVKKKKNGGGKKKMITQLLLFITKEKKNLNYYLGEKKKKKIAAASRVRKFLFIIHYSLFSTLHVPVVVWNSLPFFSWTLPSPP